MSSLIHKFELVCMPKRSNEFQKLVLAVKRAAGEGATITESEELLDKITGEKPEVDICVKSVVAGHEVIVSIECTDTGRLAGVDWVNEMKAKHERLPTNALVLASRKGFAKTALTLAEKYNIQTISYGKLDASAVNRLFGGSNSVWMKVFSLTPTRVVFRVPPAGDLPGEDVRLDPDCLIHNYAGEMVSTVKQLTEFYLRDKNVQSDLARDAVGDHQSFEICFPRPLDAARNRLYLQETNFNILRPIDQVTIAGNCNFNLTEFQLQHGTLGDVTIAWGTASFLGNKALLVASDNPQTGKKSVSIENMPKKASKRKPAKRKRRSN